MCRDGFSVRGVAGQATPVQSERHRERIAPLIPIVFIPGIMGSNLRVQGQSIPEVRKHFEEENRQAEFTTEAWSAPNIRYSKSELAKQAIIQAGPFFDCATVRVAKRWDGYGPKLRQVLLNPATTEVNPEGFIPDSLRDFPTAPGRSGPDEARRRGWGTVYWDSYGSFLTYLETQLQWGPVCTQDSIATQTMQLKHQLTFGEACSLPGAVMPSPEEIGHAARFRYPVFAFGYNWTRSNLESAKLLLQKIDQWITEYQQAGHDCKQVILVTHSMGGLVARVAAKMDKNAVGGKGGKKQILGVVHGVMPATGAPVLYRRVAGGTEPEPRAPFLPALLNAFTLISGRTAADTTPIVANSPGCLELLPSHLYPPGWLRVERNLGHGEVQQVFALPEKDDPYQEIYEQKEVWWRMVDPQLLDPALIHSKTEDGFDPEKAWAAYLKRITDVKNFHKMHLGKDDYHDADKTFGFYGQGERTFASVRWLLAHTSAVETQTIRSAKATGGDHQTFRRFIADHPKTRAEPGSIGEFLGTHDLSSRSSKTYLLPGTTDDTLAGMGIPTFQSGSARLQAQDGEGDGTVPVESGRAPGERIATITGFHGLAHESAYSGDILPRLFTILAICRLAKHSSCQPVDL
jgi:pimeloyl-ACP methyl ester carboxylesterase